MPMHAVLEDHVVLEYGNSFVPAFLGRGTEMIAQADLVLSPTADPEDSSHHLH